VIVVLLTELTHDDLTAQATVFFLAGFETSSTVLSFALLELALNPDVQLRAREDIETALAQHDGEITYQAMLDMKYLDCVIEGMGIVY
jgi:cytochrome P450 family 6